jgi:transcription termination factor Rho
MSVLDRSALSDSPLADLHAIASELSIDGYRRLRRPELIDAILTRQGSEDAGSVDAAASVDDAAVADAAASVDDAADAGGAVSADGAASADGEAEESPSRRRRGRRGGRGRAAQDDSADTTDDAAAAAGAAAAESAADESTAGESAAAETEEAEPAVEKPRRRRGGRSAEKTADGEPPSVVADADTPARSQDSETVEGVVELLANGSGFVRVNGSEASDDDVYISAAQVKRCELVAGDRVSGPKRAPRRSERYASMIRIESINDRPASELADSVRFDDLPSTLPTERIVIGSEDPTLEAIEWLTPFGRGSRVTIVGGARAGKTEALRRLATALAGSEDLTVLVALAGVRPEEIHEYSTDPAGTPAAAVSFAVSHDAAAAAVEPVIDQARRLAARGGDAVVLLDTLDGLSPHTARKLMASARNIVEGGSVTVVATANAPIGGETTVIALDAMLTGAGRFPALDLLASGTIKPELLVGEAGAEVIAKTRSEVMNGEDAHED